MKSSAKLILASAALAIAAAAGYAFTRQETAPEVRFVTLAGDRLATSDLRGKVVLVNFWATSCVTCVHEMPMLSDTYRKFAPRGYETIAVAMSYDHPNQVAEFARQRQLPFKVAIDTDGSIARQFGNVRVTPTTYLLDKKGRVIKTYLGEPKVEEFHALLEKALAEPA
ncbi:MAG: TlpA family protein disulfide reductase [Betaproteobacteria bacterium]|nr:TlpA family protein disulfide reductase [Betaproteobacteria bacterium]